MSSPALTTSRQNVDNVVVIRLSGELRGDAQDQLLQAVQAEMQQGRLNIVLDAGGLTFVSSRGFAALIRLVSRVRKRYGDVRLAGLNQRIGPMVRLLRLDRLLNIYHDVNAAVASFQRDVWM